MEKVFDLLINNDDLVFGEDGEPLYIEDLAAIAQDVRHRVRESGLYVNLIGDRGQVTEVMNAIILLVEEDKRITPGSVKFQKLDTGRYMINAKTIDNQVLEVAI